MIYLSEHTMAPGTICRSSSSLALCLHIQPWWVLELLHLQSTFKYCRAAWLEGLESMSTGSRGLHTIQKPCPPLLKPSIFAGVHLWKFCPAHQIDGLISLRKWRQFPSSAIVLIVSTMRHGTMIRRERKAADVPSMGLCHFIRFS